MKKQRNYAWLAVLIVMLMAAVPSVLPSVLNAQQPPCPNGLCQGYIGRASDGIMCDRCAEKNGYCKTHSNQAPRKDGVK